MRKNTYRRNPRVGRKLLSVVFGSAFKQQNPGREESFLQEPSPEPITIHAVASPTRKRRGEAAEAAFLARATHLGFTVCLPWGDSERYDSVVDMGQRFLRVQVKSATGYAEHRYRVKTAGASGVPYTPAEIDFFVAYIVPEDIWYIIPIAAIGRRKGVRFYPNARRPSRARFEKYREAWCLLACPPKARGWRDIPVTCRRKILPVRCAVCPNLSAPSPPDPPELSPVFLRAPCG